MYVILIIDTGGIFPFTNPAGILVFVEQSVQKINLTVVNNDKVKVSIKHYCMYIEYVYTYVHVYHYFVCMYKYVCNIQNIHTCT